MVKPEIERMQWYVDMWNHVAEGDSALQSFEVIQKVFREMPDDENLNGNMILAIRFFRELQAVVIIGTAREDGSIELNDAGRERYGSSFVKADVSAFAGPMITTKCEVSGQIERWPDPQAAWIEYVKCGEPKIESWRDRPAQL